MILTYRRPDGSFTTIGDCTELQLTLDSKDYFQLKEERETNSLIVAAAKSMAFVDIEGIQKVKISLPLSITQVVHRT